MLYSKKKTDGVSSQERIRLIPPSKIGAKVSTNQQPQNVQTTQPVVSQQQTANKSVLSTPKVESPNTTKQNNPTNFVNMMLSQPSTQPVATTPQPIEEKPIEEKPIAPAIEQNVVNTNVRRIVPVSNEKKYEEIEKQNPLVKTLKNKFNLQV